MTTVSGIARDLDEACRAVLGHFRIDHSDSLLALAFGSRARGQERATSDFDLIFVVQPRTSYPDFSYQRLTFADGTIDANIIQPDMLDVMCRRETGWAYRLYGARTIPEFSRVPRPLSDAWLQRHDALIRHPLAWRRRLLGHLADCRALMRASYRLRRQSSGLSAAPVISAYLMVEALFLVPLIQLNLLGLVPFETGDPWSSALAANPAADFHAQGDYGFLLETVTRSDFYVDIALGGSFSDNLKSIRDRCRSAVIRHLGYVFGDGFGKTLAERARVDEPLQSELTEILAGVRPPRNELMEAVATWTGKVLGRVPTVTARAGRRKPIPRRKSKITGTRLVDYRPETGRLKVILPTGGCRVPTCTFCMLPYLARAKGNIEPIVAAAAAAIDRRPVGQVAIYTDGSFFDGRELGGAERLALAESSRRWGATEFLVESLPRFLTQTALAEVRQTLGPACSLRIGIGLQSTNPSVRRHVTGTPISQTEMLSTLALRASVPFTLRLYLLANKPMMTAREDMLDLQRSLDMLDGWLGPEDVVTINPLLPTHGTLVEWLEAEGHWRPLSPTAVTDLVRSLQATPRHYTVEFGPTTTATCTDSNLDIIGDNAFLNLGDRDGEAGTSGMHASLSLWSLLGDYRSRLIWAQTAAGSPRPANVPSRVKGSPRREPGVAGHGSRG